MQCILPFEVSTPILPLAVSPCVLLLISLSVKYFEH